MVKLGNEANPVPVLAQQPNTTLPAEGSSLPEYVPVPPLPSDYSNNANFSAYSNLVPSQLAAYNEWIAIQAYHHFIALAHNASVYIQEERLRSQQQLTNNEGEGIDTDNATFPAPGLVDGATTSSQAAGIFTWLSLVVFIINPVIFVAIYQNAITAGDSKSAE
ncbi:hypothetical protein AA313_de0201336 [Arthrobotrys entomopaga]|nr:hypothetical protein AA313_de0201336 [Arthrobotrys entomopaga]